MSMENLRDVILSDEYLDFILPYYDGIEQDFSEYGIQFFNSHLVMIHSRRPSENLINYLETDELRYTTLPKLYSLLNLVSLESSGILTVQNQPSLDLKGRNVIVGFIDTGVDYTHSAFLTRDKRTRILALWDQNIQTGQPPFDLSYGSVYFEESMPLHLPCTFIIGKPPLVVYQTALTSQKIRVKMLLHLLFYYFFAFSSNSSRYLS